jgi:hypothetical protein
MLLPGDEPTRSVKSAFSRFGTEFTSWYWAPPLQRSRIIRQIMTFYITYPNWTSQARKRNALRGVESRIENDRALVRRGNHRTETCFRAVYILASHPSAKTRKGWGTRYHVCFRAAFGMGGPPANRYFCMYTLRPPLPTRTKSSSPSELKSPDTIPISPPEF